MTHGNNHRLLKVQVLLVACVFKKCDFILKHSSNLNQFQPIVLTLMQTACWLIKWAGRRGSRVLYVWLRRNVRVEGTFFSTYAISYSATFLWNTNVA
jgi:hypothetical protein